MSPDGELLRVREALAAQEAAGAARDEIRTSGVAGGAATGGRGGRSAGARSAPRRGRAAARDRAADRAAEVPEAGSQQRVGEQPDAAELDEHRGVADPRDPPVISARAASTSRSSSPSGSSVRPVWTGEHWMIVLDGRDEPVEALGRRQRRDRARGRVAGRDPHERVEVPAHRVEVDVGRERAQRAPRRAPRARRGSGAGGRTARRRRSGTRRARPAGTTRTIAYWNGLGGTARLLGLGGEAARRPRAGGTGTRRTRRALRGANQSSGICGEHALDASRGPAAAPAARRPRAMSPAHGSSTWLRIAGNGRCASAGGSSQACWR